MQRGGPPGVKCPGSRDYSIDGTAELTQKAHTAGRPETTGRMFFSSRNW